MKKPSQMTASEPLAPHYKLMLGGLAALVVGLVLWKRGGEPPSFDLSTIDSSKDLELVGGLASDLRRASRWSPWALYGGDAAEDEFTAALSLVIVERGDARSGGDLLQAVGAEPPGLPAAAEPADAQLRTATLNGLIELLAVRLDASRLRALRQTDEFSRRSRLAGHLEAAIKDHRKRTCARIVSAPGAQQLLQQYDIPPYPSSDAADRRDGDPEHDWEPWVDGFLAAYARDIRPVERGRALLSAAPQIRFGGSGELSLVWGGRDLESYVDQWTSQGSVRVDCELAYATSRLSAAASQDPQDNDAADQYQVVWDTGIRLKGVALRPSPSAERVEIDWPPTSASAIQSQFESFLHSLGMPREFRVEQIHPSLPAGTQQIVLDFEIGHAEVKSFRQLRRLVFDHADDKSGMEELRSGLRNDLRAELVERLARLETYRGLPVAINPLGGGESRFQVSIEYPEIGLLTMGLTVSEQGRLCLSGVPGVEQRRRLAVELCRSHPLLNELQHVVLIDAVNLEDGAADLRGSLRVQAKAIDGAENIGPLEWRYEVANRRASIGLDRQHIRDLRGLKERLSQLQKAAPGDPQSLADAIAEYLRVKYPLLAGDVNVGPVVATDAGAFVSLRLMIGDYPEIALGPVVVDVDHISERLDPLLTTDSVLHAANQQWSSARTHVRFGRAKFQLTGWRPQAGEADIACSVPLEILDDGQPASPALISWREMQRQVGGQWRSLISNDEGVFEEFSVERLCARLDGNGRLRALEQRIGRFISDVSGTDVDLGIERDAFGPGRWLSLNPVGVRVYVGLGVPFPPVRVGAGDILVDRDGIHMPDSYSVAYRRTFPTAYCNISDPNVTVNTATYGLAVSCKITPPFGSGFGGLAIGDPSESSGGDAASEAAAEQLKEAGLAVLPTRIRRDNLWLHIVYAEAEVEGVLRDKQLAARTDVWLMERYRVGAGEISVDVDDKEVGGFVHAGANRWPWMPHCNGSLRLSARDGMSMRTSFLLAGLAVQGDLRYPPAEQDPRVRIRGRSRVPLVGDVTFRGSSDLALERAQIEAQGNVAASKALGPMATGRLHYHLFAARPGGYRLSIRWQTKAGAVEVTRSGFSVDQVDEQDLKNALQERFASGQLADSAEPPSPELAELISRLPPVPQIQEPENAAPPEIALAAGGGGLRRLHRFGWQSRRGVFRLYDKASQQDYLKLNAAQLGFRPTAKSKFGFLLREPGQGGILFAIAPATKRLWLIDCPSANQVDPDSELVKRFEAGREALESLDPFQPKTAVQQAVANHVLLLARGLDPRTTQESGGVLVRHQVPSDPLVIDNCFYWDAPPHVGQVAFSNGVADERQQTPEFFKRIAGLALSEPARLVGLGEAGSAAAFLIPTADVQEHKLVARGERACQATLVSLEHLGAGDFDEAARAVANAHLSGEIELANGSEALLGNEGVCIPFADKMVVRRASVAQGRFLVVTEGAFLDWAPKTSQHLPPGLRTPVGREQMWHNGRMELAEEIVTGWREHLNHAQWGANPMGLMIGVAGGYGPSD